MKEELRFYVDAEGVYLGAMGGELLNGSPHPYPKGIEVGCNPDRISQRWDFSLGSWMPREDDDTQSISPPSP